MDWSKVSIGCAFGVWCSNAVLFSAHKRWKSAFVSLIVAVLTLGLLFV